MLDPLLLLERVLESLERKVSKREKKKKVRFGLRDLTRDIYKLRKWRVSPPLIFFPPMTLQQRHARATPMLSFYHARDKK